MVTRTDDQIRLDAVDRGILYTLQEDARNTTHEMIGKAVDVSPSTVRNRINRLEESGVIEGYVPRIDYERAGYPLHVQLVCTAPPTERSRLAREVLDVDGVVTVHEVLTGEQNVLAEIIATDTADLAAIIESFGTVGLTIHRSDIITDSYSQPLRHFEPEDGDEKPLGNPPTGTRFHDI